MKLSDKLLLVFVSVVVLAAMVFLFALRGAMTETVHADMRTPGFSADSIAYAGEPFADIVVSGGGWDITVTPGDSHAVVIERDEETNRYVRAAAFNGALVLETSDMSLTAGTIHVAITAPALSSLKTRGAVSAAFVGYAADSVLVDAAGGTVIEAKDCSFEHLGLTLKGFSEVNAQTSVIRSASLNANGAYEIEIALDGGTLSGDAQGVGGIVVYGNAGKVTLETAELVELTYKEKYISRRR